MKDNWTRYVDHLIQWLHDERDARAMTGYVFGLSGGIDSAVVSFLLAKADLNNSLAVMLPCHSHPNDLKDAHIVADASNMPNITVDLSDTHRTLYDAIGASRLQGQTKTETLVIDGNMRARLRMATLYAIAQANQALVVGTDNQVEWQMGYFTKYGDGGVDIVPLIHLMKDEVFDLARHLGVPSAIIHKAPSGGLWEDQTDEGEIGISYDEMNRALRGEFVSDHVQKVVKHWQSRSVHKRELPHAPKPLSEFQ